MPNSTSESPSAGASKPRTGRDVIFAAVAEIAGAARTNAMLEAMNSEPFPSWSDVCNAGNEAYERALNDCQRHLLAADIFVDIREAL